MYLFTLISGLYDGQDPVLLNMLVLLPIIAVVLYRISRISNTILVNIDAWLDKRLGGHDRQRQKLKQLKKERQCDHQIAKIIARQSRLNIAEDFKPNNRRFINRQINKFFNVDRTKPFAHENDDIPISEELYTPLIDEIDEDKSF